MKINFVVIILCCTFYSTLNGQITHFKKQSNYHNLKSDNLLATMQKLDSLIASDTGDYKYKEAYTYDEKGNVVVISYAYIDSADGQWLNSGKKEIEYDSKNYVIKETCRVGVSNSKYEYIYDLTGNLTKYIYSYMESGGWLNYQKIEYIYDERSNLIIETQFEWQMWQEMWKRIWKYELTYNDSDLLTESSSYKWQEGSEIWKIFGRNKYTYDDNLHKTEKLRILWSDDVNYWINYEKNTYSYDTSGNQRQEIRTKWDTTINQWVNVNKYKYLYDDQNRMIENINYMWRTYLDDWSVLSRFQYIYDAEGNRTKRIESDLDVNANEWINILKFEYSYNNDFSKTDLILPYYDYADMDTLFTHMLTELEYFNWNQSLNRWESQAYTAYYYSDITFFGIEDNYNSEIKIYPNPANNDIWVDYKVEHSNLRFAIYDTYGKMLKQGELSNSGKDKISISELNEGMYIIRITNQNKVFAIKFLKK